MKIEKNIGSGSNPLILIPLPRWEGGGEGEGNSL